MADSEMDQQNLQNTRLNSMRDILSDLGSVLVAYSGGVDSSFLLAIAIDVLGADNVLAVTLRSALNPPGEVAKAREIAEKLDANHTIVDFEPLDVQQIAENSPRRCYHCKRRVFEKLLKIAERRNIPHVVHAEQADDADRRRPGSEAAEEPGIRAPLAEADIGKDDIRALSRRMGLEGWQRPSTACLASRVPYGNRITSEKLDKIAAAETALHELGIGQLRVRDHGHLARIELLQPDIEKLAEGRWRKRVIEAIKDAGYHYVAVDLEGFRSGSADEII